MVSVVLVGGFGYMCVCPDRRGLFRVGLEFVIIGGCFAVIVWVVYVIVL